MRQPRIPSLSEDPMSAPPSFSSMGIQYAHSAPWRGRGGGEGKNKTSLGPDSGNGPAHFNGYKAQLVLAVRTVHSGEPCTLPVTGCCVNVMETALVIIGRFRENRIQGRASLSLTQPQCHPEYTAWNMTPNCVTQLPNTAASMVLSHHY